MSAPKTFSNWIAQTGATHVWVPEISGWRRMSIAEISDDRLSTEIVGGDLQIDSRVIKKGDVYVALKGTQVDGHQFIGNAIQNGASFVLSETNSVPSVELADVETPVMYVPNLREELGQIAQWYYGNPAQKLSIIAITGTNGKTTISTLIWQALSGLGVKAGLLGTAGGFIGSKSIAFSEGAPQMTTSDAIQLAKWMKEMVSEGVSHLVLEASSHALDQGRLNGLDISVAVFSNLSHEHLDYHGTIEAYAAAKKRLFDRLTTGSTAIVNVSDEWGLDMVSDTQADIWQVAYGENSEQISSTEPAGLRKTYDLRYSDLLPSEGDGLRIIMQSGGSSLKFLSQLQGQFNAMNLAEAFLALKALGFREEALLDVMYNLKGAPGRLEKIHTTAEHEPLVLVDYAHTPDALEKVATVAAELKKSRERSAELWILFGCGGNRDRAKRPVMAEIAQRFGDQVIVTSDNPRFEDPERIIDEVCNGFRVDGAPFKRIVDRAEAIEYAILNAHPSDIVLIAGKGHETGQIIGDEILPMDDRREALKALESRAKKMEEV